MSTVTKASPTDPSAPLGAVQVQDWYTTTTIVLFDGKTSLKPGESIKSPNGKYSLEFQTDENLVLYSNKDGSRNAEWASNTKDSGANLAAFQTDGNLVVYKDDKPMWDSNTYVEKIGEEGWTPRHFTLDNGGGMFIVLVKGDAERIYSPGSSGSRFVDVGNTISIDPNDLLDVKNKKCTLKFQFQSKSEKAKKVTVPINLNKVVGNSNGTLVYGGKDFAESSKDIAAVVRNGKVYLQASCKNNSGDWGLGVELPFDKSFFLSFVNQVNKTLRGAFKNRSADNVLKNADSIYWAFKGNQYEANDKDFLYYTPNGKYLLIFQGDGNLVLYEYDDKGNRTKKWASMDVDGYFKDHHKPGPGKKLFLQRDGNMVICGPDGKTVEWASCKHGDDEYYLGENVHVVANGSTVQTAYYGRGRFLHLTNDGKLSIIVSGAHEAKSWVHEKELSRFQAIPANNSGGFDLPKHIAEALTAVLCITAAAMFFCCVGAAASACVAAAPAEALVEAEVEGVAINVEVIGETELEEMLDMEIPESMREGFVFDSAEAFADFQAEAVETIEANYNSSVFTKSLESFITEGTCEAKDVEPIIVELQESGVDFEGLQESVGEDVLEGSAGEDLEGPNYDEWVKGLTRYDLKLSA